MTALSSGKLSLINCGEQHFFLPEQIVRLEALSNYTCIHFINHKPILMARVLREYETMLRPYGFIRTHRSHLVNAKHVVEVDENGSITMYDRSRAEISRRKRKEVFRELTGKKAMVA
jgi:two-component system, LytTR family, response regulator